MSKLNNKNTEITGEKKSHKSQQIAKAKAEIHQKNVNISDNYFLQD